MSSWRIREIENEISYLERVLQNCSERERYDIKRKIEDLRSDLRKLRRIEEGEDEDEHEDEDDGILGIGLSLLGLGLDLGGFGSGGSDHGFGSGEFGGGGSGGDW